MFSTRDKKLLIILLGVSVLIIMYFLVYLNFVEQAQTAQMEIDTLEPELLILQQYNENLPLYEEEISIAREYIEEEVQKYHGDIKEEDLIMWTVGMGDEVNLQFDSLSFSEYTPISTFDCYVELGSREVLTEVDTYQRNITTNGQVSYDNLKNMLDYIYEDPKYTSLNNISLSYDASTAQLTASIDISRFILNYIGAEYQAEQLPNLPLGVPNIFGTRDFIQSSGSIQTSPQTTPESSTQNENTQENTNTESQGSTSTPSLDGMPSFNSQPIVLT